MESIVKHSRVGIVGLGQLGGSLGLRFKELGCRSVLAVARRDESLQQAKDRGIIDGGSTVAGDILPLVDIVFICIPLTATLEFVRQNLAHFPPGSLVTDVGSVKGVIVRELRELLLGRGICFIGSHPMAGSEKSGLDHARAEMFQDCVCFVTPTEEDEEETLSLLGAFWREIGACVIELDAARHDQAAAFGSHMLHMISGAVVRSVLCQGDVEAQRLASAGGFRDSTRIASSEVSMWTEISKYNRDAILCGLAVFEAETAEIRKILEDQDWEALSKYLEEAKEARDGWLDSVEAKRSYRKKEQTLGAEEQTE